MSIFSREAEVTLPDKRNVCLEVLAKATVVELAISSSWIQGYPPACHVERWRPLSRSSTY
jgi:hypothetical protein